MLNLKPKKISLVLLDLCASQLRHHPDTQPIEKLPLPELKADGSLRFPWPARLSPQSRNLYRAATPIYRFNGTPEVFIPSKVLRLGPENKDEYIIGKFHKCSLPPGVLFMLWSIRFGAEVVRLVVRSLEIHLSCFISLTNLLVNGLFREEYGILMIAYFLYFRGLPRDLLKSQKSPHFHFGSP